MPPACTPEKNFDAQRNTSAEETGPLLGYVTPPRNNYNCSPKHTEGEERYLKWVSQKLPTLVNIFLIHKKIGEGTFSTVFLASLHNELAERRLFAVKHLVPTTHPKRIEVELHCLKQIGGKDNVAGVDLCIRENGNVLFIMPYLKHDHFSDYVHDMKSTEAALFIKNLLQALSRVHTFGIIHRDVKPNNFLYDRKNKKFLLIDFGLAQLCSTNTQNNNENLSLKRKRESIDNSETETKTECEPVAKRPALHSRNISNLNSTITHLQKCSTEALMVNHKSSKENMPSNTDIPNAVKKSPMKNTCQTSRKSPFKFPGLDLPSSHSKMAMKIKGQRNLFQNDEKNKIKPKSPALNRVVKEEPTSSPKHAKVDPNPNPQKPAQYCRCYGKASVCPVCLVRKCQDAPRAGTPGFRPPEVLLKYAKQTTAVDIWAVGIMFLCILSGTYPFFRAPDDVTALAEMLTIFGDEPMRKLARIFGRQLSCSEKRPPLDLRKICCRLRSRGNKTVTKSDTKCQQCSQFSHNCVCLGTSMEGITDSFPDSAYDLLLRLLDINPYTRITADEALKHPFLIS